MVDQATQRKPRRGGFSLTELLVVIAIIAGLIALLLPMIGKLRGRAYEASTNAMLAQIAAGFDNYYNVFHAYPGPIPNAQISTWKANLPGPPIEWWVSGSLKGPLPNTDKITETENAVLGLLGGLQYNAATAKYRFDPDFVGKGPLGLNPAQPKKYDEFMTSARISEGHYKDSADQDANDTIVPEFVDAFPEAMPFLVFRANPGRTGPSTPDEENNAIVTDGSPNGRAFGHYDISQVIGYTGAYTGSFDPTTSQNNLTLSQNGRLPNTGARTIGVGKELPNVCQVGDGNMVGWKGQPAYHGLNFVDPDSLNAILDRSAVSGTTRYYYPYDAFPYLTNHSFPVPPPASVVPTPRQKDRYIIISAGKDRVYGTDDDITNFGSVTP